MSHSLNLIPVATQRRQTLRRVTRVWLVWAAASGACAALLLGVEWLRGVAAMRELMELDARYAPFLHIAEERQVLTKRIDQLHSREASALQITRDEYGMALLGALSQAVANCDGAVYVDNLSYRRSARQTDAGKSTLQLNGVGFDGISIAGFAAKLRESGAFSELTVQNTQPIAGGAASLRQYSIVGSM